MKHILQLTTALSLIVCSTTLLALATNAQGQGLQQPATLTAPESGLAAAETDTQVTPAGCCDGGSGCCGNGCGCEPVCCPKCVVEEVEKKCWMVKSEFVCVPGFRWPWECCDKSNSGGDASCGSAGDSCCGDGCCGCPAKCGKVRCVNVLEEHKYACKECGYEWNVKCVRSGNRCSCQGGCCPECGCDPSCGACAAVDVAHEVQLTAAAEAAPATQIAAGRPNARPSLLERLGFK